MDTLVLKCKESVQNDNLRSINELRFRAISQGTGANQTSVNPKDTNGNYIRIIQYRILSGSGILLDNNNVIKGTEYDVKFAARVRVPSGESVVQIKNFELVTDQVLGSESYPFWGGVAEANYPIFVLDIKEIQNKTFLKQINLTQGAGGLGYIDNDDIGNLSNFTELTYFNAINYVNQKLGGSLSSLSKLKKLKTFLPSNYNHIVSFRYCIDDFINMTALVNCDIDGGIFDGGDIFSLLSNKNYINYKLTRQISKTNNLVCSYVSGSSTIPTFTLKYLNISSGSVTTNKIIDLANTKSLLTLIKDGINANKITVESDANIIIGLTSTPDTELNILKNQVVALGVSVTLN